MKTLFPILAIYLLAVFLMPCSDMHVNEASQTHNHLDEIAHKSDSDSSDSIDLCSPFCLCNCCGRISGFVFQWETITFPLVNSIKVPNPLPQYIPQLISLYSYKIWQPPKINV